MSNVVSLIKPKKVYFPTTHSQLALLEMLNNSDKTKRPDGSIAVFDILTLTKDNYIWKLVEESFPDYCFKMIRLHHWLPEHYARPHKDTIFPGCDTLIIRLDNYGPSRLKVMHSFVQESSGVGYILPEGTIHEVTPCRVPRYSITAWLQNHRAGQ